MPQDKPLKILVTSDIHAHLTLDPPNRRPGLARLATYVNALKATARVVLLDAGDLFSGSFYGAADHGRAVAKLVGQLGYAGLLPGNHDFDYCPEVEDPLYYFNTLLPAARVESPKLRTLAFNLRYQGQPVGNCVEPLVLRVDPPVVVLGVMSPLTHRPSLGSFLNDFDFGLKASLAQTKEALLASLAKTLAPLERVGGQAIILSHLGASTQAHAGLRGQLSLDFANAPLGQDLTEIPGVSLVVDGHSHEVIPPSRPGQKALYLNLGQGLEALAEITLNNPPAPLSVKLLTFEELANLEPDPTISAQIETLGDLLGFGQELTDLPPQAPYSLAGLWETITPLGQLVVEAMAWKAGAQLALLNKGALREGLSGRVTRGSVRQALPFNDQLIPTVITGRELTRLLRRAGQKGFLGFPLYHGLELWAYPDGDEARLVGVTLANGEELELGRAYSLALSGQMARLLARTGLSLPAGRPLGTVTDAVIELIERRRGQAFLHDPLICPYRLFENETSAQKAFATWPRQPQLSEGELTTGQP
ncbi:MAG: 5'-nucleotidase C-terminal domain-containing protein [Deltaproteobacteria bacterium]|jgi:5'-nucleotidase/UDP-sugar diphosphatase|nr:5'-nucleotidase C-terminal domain-containing protein [Deltaproteobacteria bacterium]